MPQTHATTEQKSRPREKNAYINSIILAPMGLEQARESLAHYFIDQQGNALQVNSSSIIGQRFDGAKWEGENIADRSIVVAVDYNHELKNKNALPDQKTETIGFLEFIRNAGKYKQNNQGLKQPSYPGTIIEKVYEIARSNGIKLEDLQLLSELDLLPASQVKNTLPASLWLNLMPTVEFLDAKDLQAGPHEIESFKLGYTGPEILKLKTDLSSIGYDIEAANSTLDQQTFDCCAALNEKFLGIATLAEQHQSQAITSRTINLAGALSKAKQRLGNTQKKQREKFLESATSRYIKQAKKELFDDTNKSSNKDFAFGVALALVAATVSILLVAAPFSIPYLSHILDIIGAPAIAVAAAFMFTTCPDAKNKLTKELRALSENTEQYHKALNKLAGALQQPGDKTNAIITRKPSPPPQGPKPETLKFYGMITAGMVRDIVIVMLSAGIVIAITNLLALPAAVSAALFSLPMIIGALIGTHGAFGSKIMLMQDADRHTTALIENIRAENEFLKQTLEARSPVNANAKQNAQVDQKTNEIQKINKNFRNKKYALILGSIALGAALIAISALPAMFPTIIVGVLGALVGKIAVSILMTVLTTIAIKEYHTISAEKTVNIAYSLIKEQRKIVQRHLGSNPEPDPCPNLKRWSLQEEKRMAKSLLWILGHDNVLRGGRLVLVGASIMLSSIALVPLVATALALPTVVSAVIVALFSLSASLLIKYGMKISLAQTNSLENIQTTLAKIYFETRETASYLSELAQNILTKKGPGEMLPTPESEYLKLQTQALSAEANHAVKKISKAQTRAMVYYNLLLPSNVIISRLKTRRSALSLTSLALFNIAATTIAFFTVPVIAPVLAVVFALASSFAAEAFDESIFSYYAPMQIAGDMIKSIDLSRKQSALFAEAVNCVEQYDPLPKLEGKKDAPEITADRDMSDPDLKNEKFIAYTATPLVSINEIPNISPLLC